MNTSIKLSLATLIALSSLVACTKEEPKPQPKEPAPAVAALTADLAKRGGELVRIGGCNDCHTPLKFDPGLNSPAPDMSRMLSGHPEGAPGPKTNVDPSTGEGVAGPTMTSWKLPFGVVYTANLTPDVETGLGAWSEEQFIKAMRTGKHMGAEAGRPILAPMPWMNLAGASDQDLKAIFAFLRTVPAVKNHVPEPQVPAEVLAGMTKTNEKIAQLSKREAR